MDRISPDKTLINVIGSVSAQDLRGSCCHNKCHDHDDCHDDCHDECHDHDDCHDIESVVEGTVRCFRELRCLATEVLKRLDCGHREHRLLTVYTCLILEDINSVFKEIAIIKDHICCHNKRTTDTITPNEIFCSNVTSGTIFVTNEKTDKVRAAIVNNTKSPQTVRVRILNSCVNPHSVINEMQLEVNSGCSGIISQSLASASSYEIQVFDLVPGMSVSSVEESRSGNFIDGTKLVATAFIPNLGI